MIWASAVTLTSREASRISRANRAAKPAGHGACLTPIISLLALRAQRRRCRETDLSAEQIGAQAPPRLSHPHGDQRRAPGVVGAPRAGAQEAERVTERLTAPLRALWASPCRASVGKRASPDCLTPIDPKGRHPKVCTMERLKRRTDFRAAAQALRAPAKAFVLQARARGDDGAVRVGFTVSRQVGNAVVRNRVRRRLREVVRLVDAGQFRAGHDYVLIGRPPALQLPFADLTRDFANALLRVHASPAKVAPTSTAPAGAGSERSLHTAGSPSRPRRQPEQRGKPHDLSGQTPSRHTPQRPEPKDEP